MKRWSQSENSAQLSTWLVMEVKSNCYKEQYCIGTGMLGPQIKVNLWITKKLWKIQEMGIPDQLTCLLRNLFVGQEATVRTGHGIMDWFQIGKGVRHACILSPCFSNLYAEYIMWNTRLDEAQLESRWPEEISITLDRQMTPSLWQKAKRN